MSRFMRPCLDCGTLARGSRCETHQAEADRKNEKRKDTYLRRARKAALYDSNYKKKRRALLAVATHCHLCGRPFTPYDRIEADHVIAGDPTSPLLPAHRFCNASRGNKPLAGD
jgi:5-methylcytosine-specific restriction endonuclease McrA